MNGFSLWFGTGLGHILDPAAYDHILFVSLLALCYPLKEWKKLLVLVTAFTVGHSLTLVLSVIAHPGLSTPVIEFAIAFSILVTGIFNLFGSRNDTSIRPALFYLFTLLFGLLHGLGFSFLLRSMLGKESDIFLPLLYFNLGIEAGQLIIVVAVLLISLFLTTVIHVSYKHFKFITVCIIILIALKMSVVRFLQLLA